MKINRIILIIQIIALLTMSFPVSVFADSGYTVDYDKVSDYDFVITNSRNTNKVSKTAKIIWDDDGNRDGLRKESLKASLYAGGISVDDTAVLSGDSSEWSHTWETLEENSGGVPIAYSFAITDTVDGYTPTVSDDGWTITYTHTPALVTKAAILKWDDLDNIDSTRPLSGVNFQLYANDAVLNSPKNAKNHDDTAVWEDLFVNEAGQPITYSVEQVESLSAYTTTKSEDGWTITNKHLQNMVQFAYSVEWKDGDNVDQYRPENLVVSLNNNGTSVLTATIPAADNTASGMLDEVPVNEAGQPIVYTLTFDDIPEYSKSIVKDGNTWKIVLTHEVKSISVTGNIRWEDSDNADKIRPAKNRIMLLADGESASEYVEVSSGNGWKNTWANLRESANGHKIVYTIQQEVVPSGYAESSENDGLTLVNTHTAAESLAEVAGTVKWEDGNDRDLKRPSEITLQLYAGTLPIGSPIKVQTDKNETMSFSFGEFPYLDENNNPIEYSVVEEDIDGYNAPLYSGNGGFTITNHRDPESPEPFLMIDVIKDASNSGTACVVNGRVNITLTVANTGTMTARNVTVRDYLPAGGTFIQNSLHFEHFTADDTLTQYSETGDIENNTTRIQANISEMDAGEKYVIRYSMVLEDPANTVIGEALFDYGNENPVSADAVDPGMKSNKVASCTSAVEEPEETTEESGSESIEVSKVKSLPGTGFAPNVVTNLSVSAKPSYDKYSTVSLQIPAIGVSAEILGVPFEDGTWDISWLGDNIGWLQPSAFPGNTGASNSVLTGHVVNSSGNPGVFYNLQSLKYGDVIIVRAFGEIYTYKVEDVTVIANDNYDVLKVSDMPRMTLLTCKYYDEATNSYGAKVSVQAILDSISSAE